MKIYIGYDFDNRPISVLLAENEDKANIAWAGMKDTPHHTEVIDPNNNDLGISGVVFLLTSTERTVGNALNSQTFRKFKRGL